MYKRQTSHKPRFNELVGGRQIGMVFTSPQYLQVHEEIVALLKVNQPFYEVEVVYGCHIADVIVTLMKKRNGRRPSACPFHRVAGTACPFRVAKIVYFLIYRK